MRCIWTTLFFLIFHTGFAQTEKTTKENASITFFIASDLHFGSNDSIISISEKVALDMTTIPGTFYPDSLWGKVDVPQWVSFTGDLTDHGRSEEWNDFTTQFGLNGQGNFPYRVYEGFGNHDGSNNGPIRSGIKARNIQREGVTSISQDSLHYSWDRNGVHFVNLNSYPGKDWDPACEWCPYFKEGFRDPSKSLVFLKKDLKKNVGKSDLPIVLFFHYGFDEWGDKWWTSKEQNAFYKTIKKYNIIAIFHGHTHEIDHYNWKGIPVWCAGAIQHSPKTGEYLIVRIQDHQMLVVVREREGWGKNFKVRLKQD